MQISILLFALNWCRQICIVFCGYLCMKCMFSIGGAVIKIWMLQTKRSPWIRDRLSEFVGVFRWLVLYKFWDWVAMRPTELKAGCVLDIFAGFMLCFTNFSVTFLLFTEIHLPGNISLFWEIIKSNNYSPIIIYLNQLIG